ncbi:hypothetical protein FNV43_RR10519 [Rhamnella rubrinervis]|uniref:Uncharacterized protein n=1 Tax=Rhamnella rubrinervis TaxID=2594499 RepID=A0A8K0MH03_9ROSA|nr:hypothetical protein FNV43_RR10519 [Rhamnella rubrinervis]
MSRGGLAILGVLSMRKIFKWLQKKKRDADADYWKGFACRALELMLVFFFWLHLGGYEAIHPVNCIETIFTDTFVTANFVITCYSFKLDITSAISKLAVTNVLLKIVSISKKINNNAKETQFSVRSSIPHETRSAPSLQLPQLHVTKALSPPKRSVASTSYDAPIATSLIKEMDPRHLLINVGLLRCLSLMCFDWNRLMKLVEHGLMTLKELQATDDAILELLVRKDASDRRFKEFLDSYESESPVKVRESLAMFKKEREDMKQCVRVVKYSGKEADRSITLCELWLSLAALLPGVTPA